MIKLANKNVDIKELQIALEDQGYKLEKYGTDGVLGPETEEAIRSFAKDNKLVINDFVSVRVIDAICGGKGFPITLAKEYPTCFVPERSFDVEIFDLRSEQTNPPAMAHKFKRARGRVVKRDPSQITGITIHQTAVKYDVAPFQIEAAGGNRKLALARRALNVACHAMAFHDGFVCLTNPLTWYVYHGNGFNAFELGLEIDGVYPGVIGGRTWDGRKETKTTKKSIKAAKAAIEVLVIEGRKMGMPIEYIHAHRQASSSRRADPGEELWREVVLEYAVPDLGLKTEPARVLKDGRPIPTEWDPKGIGEY